MVHFEVLESKLVYRDPNSQWYVSALILLNTGEIYYVLTHITNDKKHEIFMSQYAANDLKEFLRRWIYLILPNERPDIFGITIGTVFVFIFYYFLIY